MALSGVLPASFRGVPFAVERNTTEGGRRQVVHEYPGRDGSNPEDLGRRGRRYHVQGFLLSNSAVYGGGPVALQRQLLLAALEGAGSGLLIHPTLGLLTVCVDVYIIGDALDAGTKAEIDLTFIEDTLPSILGVSTSTISQVLSAAVAVDGAVSLAFTASTQLGLSGAATSAQWSSRVIAGGQDATALVNLASQLQGPYGRYFAGANTGYLGCSSSVYNGDQTVAQLAAAAAAARAAINSGAVTLQADFAALTPSTAAQAVTDVQALVAALLAACADPADAIRILGSLAGFANGASQPINDVYRRSAVTAAARAATAYQPSSFNDAQAVQATITGLIDNEITIAGDQGDDGTYAAFKALRLAVVTDLQARGAALAPLTTFTFAANLPDLTLAESLYGDASRADQLVQQVDPVHPLFMPTTFQALAA